MLHSTAPYSQATIVQGTRWLQISGQVAQDADGQNVGIGDVEVQVNQVLTNMKSLVEATGGTMADICRIVVYVLDRADLPKIMEARRRFFSAPYPATTALIVAGLANPDWRVEIEATACLT